MRQWIIIGLIVLVLIASYLWNRNKNIQSEGEPIPSPEEVIVQENGKVVKKTGDLIEELSAEEAEAKKKEINDNLAQVEATNLISVEGQVGSGISKKIFKDGVYYQNIDVTGLSPLQKGYYYEVWLEKEDGIRISIGRVEMTVSQGEFLYMTKEDKSDYSIVKISREIEDGNPEIGEVVLSTKTN